MYLKNITTESLLNHSSVRIIIGLFIGFPFSIIALVLSTHGLLFGFFGLMHADFYWLMAGVLTISGLLGLMGAWLRLFKATTAMSKKYHKATRIMLHIGVLTSIFLSILLIIFTGFNPMSYTLMLILFIGLLLMSATPKYKTKV